MTLPSEARRLTAPPGGAFHYLKAGDGTRLRTAAWAAPGEARGTVALLTGRNEFIEKYFETIADLQDRGFNVHMMDWRGQGLSGRPLANRMKGHVRDFTDYMDDLELFVGAIAAPNLIVVAHSMGGHIVLRALAERPALRRKVSGAVVSAAMLGINTGRFSATTARRLARSLSRAGLRGAQAPSPKESGTGFNVLTSDPDRAGDQAWFIAQEPRLALGSPTFGWLDAAFRSVAAIDLPGALEAIDVPVMLAVAGADQVVSPAAQRHAATRLRRATLVEIEGSRHEILKERDEFRGQFWAAFDDWVRCAVT
ncbi:alpha/beta fold hydrolase [Oleomonas cavernae]|uniref:alpha/beta fold hydrolase n=1 Tax=Oleomonas cavernae TaxID=2320859 RepID=UPI001313EDEC|nr:alpha/beta hydrolase [Oleomonas cavernae]